MAIPWDCVDGFYEAYWRRPEAYLDEMYVAEYPSGKASGKTPSTGLCTASVTTSARTGGPINRDLLNLDAAELGARLLIA